METATVTDVAVRTARPSDGPTIQALFEESGKWEIPGLDWTADPGPGWLIAEQDGLALGCVQVLLGQPIARLELMCIPTHLTHRVKSTVWSKLMYTGLHTCKLAGAQMVAGMVTEGLEETYGKVMEHRGAVRWFSGSTYIVRV